jgi:hypothetical protein
MQIERALFVREIGAWICAMQQVAMPSWASLRSLENSPSRKGRSESPLPLKLTSSDTFCFSARRASPSPQKLRFVQSDAFRYSARPPSPHLPWPGITKSESQKFLSSSWSPMGMGSWLVRSQESDLQLANSDLAAQMKLFQSWVQVAMSARNSAQSSCFEVFQRCLLVAPKFLASTFASLGGSLSELPAALITSAYERLCVQPPNASQEAQMKFFLDVQVAVHQIPAWTWTWSVALSVQNWHHSAMLCREIQKSSWRT